MNCSRRKHDCIVLSSTAPNNSQSAYLENPAYLNPPSPDLVLIETVPFPLTKRLAVARSIIHKHSIPTTKEQKQSRMPPFSVFRSKNSHFHSHPHPLRSNPTHTSPTPSHKPRPKISSLAFPRLLTIRLNSDGSDTCPLLSTASDPDTSSTDDEHDSSSSSITSSSSSSSSNSSSSSVPNTLTRRFTSKKRTHSPEYVPGKSTPLPPSSPSPSPSPPATAANTPPPTLTLTPPNGIESPLDPSPISSSSSQANPTTPSKPITRVNAVKRKTKKTGQIVITGEVRGILDKVLVGGLVRTGAVRRRRRRRYEVI